MRILILADNCNPDWPSLPVVGYKAARAIAQQVDVVVATHVRNRPHIEPVGMAGREVVYLDNEYIAKPLYHLGTLLRGGSSSGWSTAMGMAYPSYLAFEWQAWKHFGRDLKAGRFDLVHRITPMSPTLPSPMAKWSPVPFLLGPLNGGLKWPRQFEAELRREREWLSKVRGAYKMLPYHRSTYTHAAGILAAFEHTTEDLPQGCGDRVIDFPEVGIDPQVFHQSEPRPPRERKTVLFVGRLVPYKLPEVVVRAFANSPALRRHRLLIVGDGPERPRLEAIVKEHKLEGCVEFVGWKTQAQVGEAMRDAEIFAFPSIRELGAGVVVEAMASRMACVVVDYGAPGALIGDASLHRGVRVPITDRDRLAQDYAATLSELVNDDARLARLGHNAREHAMEHYTWEAKATKTLAVYDWLLGKRDEKPTFLEEVGVGTPQHYSVHPLNAEAPSLPMEPKETVDRLRTRI